MSVYDPTRLQRPRSLEEATSILEEASGTARVVAGNTTIYELARQGAMDDVDSLVDLSGLALSYVRETGRTEKGDPSDIQIGATTTFSEIASSRLLDRTCYYSLKETASKITPPQVRNMGTIGGAICSGIPFYDMPTTILALGAKMKIISKSTSRLVDASDFFVDYFVTTLEPTELLTEVKFRHQENTFTSFEKLGRTSADFAVVNVSVKLVLDEDMRVVDDARIAMGAISGTPVLAAEANEYLRGKDLSKQSILRAASLAGQTVREPMPSVHASSWYKKKVIPVVVRDALLSASSRAQKVSSK